MRTIVYLVQHTTGVRR